MTSTETMLQQQIDAKLDDAIEFARQIESGEYGNQWTVYNEKGDEVADNVLAATEYDALDEIAKKWKTNDDWYVEKTEFDEPTVVDSEGNETRIWDWPLSVEVKIGRPLAVVLGTGGPHVEIAQEVGRGDARLAGYWGSDVIYKHHSALQTVLDYLTDPLYYDAPEQYK